jgi:hypothetical protein
LPGLFPDVIGSPVYVVYFRPIMQDRFAVDPLVFAAENVAVVALCHVNKLLGLGETTVCEVNYVETEAPNFLD